MIRLEKALIRCRCNDKLETPVKRLRSIHCGWLAFVLAFACLALPTSVRGDNEPQTATVLVLIEDSMIDTFWLFDDEVVGILLDGSSSSGSDSKGCTVPGYTGTYYRTDATLVTKRGGRMPYWLYVRSNAPLPSHGFIPARDIFHVDLYLLSDSNNAFSINANGGWFGFFVTVGL